MCRPQLRNAAVDQDNIGYFPFFMLKSPFQDFLHHLKIIRRFFCADSEPPIGALVRLAVAEYYHARGRIGSLKIADIIPLDSPGAFNADEPCELAPLFLAKIAAGVGVFEVFAYRNAWCGYIRQPIKLAFD